MEAWSSRTVEVTVLSAENLSLNGKLVKKNAFVSVQSDGFKWQTTGIDTLGGAFPSWNEKLLVNFATDASFLYLNVQCNTSSGNRSVGVARVPVSDFTGGYVPDNYLHFLSYRLRDARDEKNGIINISVRVKTPQSYSTNTSDNTVLKVAGYATGSCSSQATGLRVQGGYGTYSSSPAPLGIPVGEVVTGVPLWWANHA